MVTGVGRGQPDPPFAVKRTRELMNWVDSGSFDLVRSGTYTRRGQEPPVTAEVQKAIAHYRERFFRIWTLLRRRRPGAAAVGGLAETRARRDGDGDDDGDDDGPLT